MAEHRHQEREQADHKPSHWIFFPNSIDNNSQSYINFAYSDSSLWQRLHEQHAVRLRHASQLLDDRDQLNKRRCTAQRRTCCPPSSTLSSRARASTVRVRCELEALLGKIGSVHRVMLHERFAERANTAAGVENRLAFVGGVLIKYILP